MGRRRTRFQQRAQPRAWCHDSRNDHDALAAAAAVEEETLMGCIYKRGKIYWIKYSRAGRGSATCSEEGVAS